MYTYKEELLKRLDEFKIHTSKPGESIKRAYGLALEGFVNDYLSKNENKDKKIRQITDYDIDIYFKDLRKTKSNATIKLRYRVLNNFFKYLYEKELTHDVFMKLSVENYLNNHEVVVDKIIPREDREKLYSYIDDGKNDVKSRLILALIMHQGFSRGEILLLKRSNIDFEFEIVYTHKEASKQLIEKVMSKRIIKLLEDYIEKNQPKLHESLLGYSNSADSTFNTYIDKLTKEIIGRKVSPTTLRNSFRAKLIEKNKSKISLVTEFLGESSKRTNDFIKEYNIISNEDNIEEIRKIINSI
ncbi:MAG: site-specific integrase [Clostridiales bacterium]|nr:site-specific integrase [Clostridiales bacterium]